MWLKGACAYRQGRFQSPWDRELQVIAEIFTLVLGSNAWKLDTIGRERKQS